MAGPEVCIGCEIGGDANVLATILSIIGAVTGVMGAGIGVLGFRAAQNNYDATIFREEFARHRVPLETSLDSIKQSLVVLRGSAHPITPIATLTSNFNQLRHQTVIAVGKVVLEAQEIDQRGLTTDKWAPALSGFQSSVEASWEVLDDAAQPEQARKQAATAIVANLDGLSAALRERINRGVRAPLTKRRWRKKA